MEENLKTATLKMSVKAGSGYNCKTEDRISIKQWEDIQRVIAGTLVSEETKIKISKEQFDGYTHRCIVEFKVKNDFMDFVTLHFYSDSDDVAALTNFFNKKKSDKVISFTLINILSKEEDESIAEFLGEVFKDIK